MAAALRFFVCPVCYSVLRCVLRRVLQCVVVYCSVLQCVAVCVEIYLTCVHARTGATLQLPFDSSGAQCVAVGCSVLHVCCGVLLCVAVCCSVLRCVAVCCIEQRRHRTKQDVSLADMHSHYVTEVPYGMFVAG